MHTHKRRKMPSAYFDVLFEIWEERKYISVRLDIQTRTHTSCIFCLLIFTLSVVPFFSSPVFDASVSPQCVSSLRKFTMSNVISFSNKFYERDKTFLFLFLSHRQLSTLNAVSRIIWFVTSYRLACELRENGACQSQVYAFFSILFCFHNLHFRSHRRRRRQHRVLTFDLTVASPAHTDTVSLSEKNLPLSFNCQELIAFRSLKMIVCHHLERPFFRLCVSKVKVSHFETKKKHGEWHKQKDAVTNFSIHFFFSLHEVRLNWNDTKK